MAQIEVERDGHVMIVTMNRPEAQERDDAHDVRADGRRVAGAERRRRPALRDPHRRRGQLLVGHGPAGDGGRRRSRRRDRRAGTPEGRPGLHLPRSAEDLPADQAGHRRGRGRRDRGRHRDPAGHRHPRRGREHALRRVGGTLVALPDGRVRGAAPAPDPVHGRGRHPADRASTSWRRRPRRSGSSVTSCPTARRSTRRARSRETIAANGPLAVEAILKTLHETQHMGEDEAFAYEMGYTGTRHGVGRLEGRPEGVRREAHAELPAQVVPLDPRTPVLVGAGVAHQHVDDPDVALEAIELMALACERAAPTSLLAAAQTVLVPRGTWRYSRPRPTPRRLASVPTRGP